MKTVRITATAALKNFRLFSNNTEVYSSEKADVASSLIDLYEKTALNYPKFFKMDNLSKVAVLTGEVLLKDIPGFSAYEAYGKGIILSTNHGCLDTDLKYQHGISVPSPALFVYTLPNVAVGELTIRHIIKGETCCLVSDNFDPDFQNIYVSSLFENAEVKYCIGGWLEFYGNKAEAFFYLAEESDDNTLPLLNTQNIQSKFYSIWKS